MAGAGIDAGTLFGGGGEHMNDGAARGPLAARMRPRTLAEFAGQHHVVGEGTVLRSVIDGERLRSLVLVGPPGTGKTTLASLVIASSGAASAQLSAVTAGVKEVRAVVAEGEQRMAATGRKTILFIDEVHRFSKTQQDALLPGVEAGVVVLIGATTENPFFSIIRPLLSRCTLFRLEPLPPGEVRVLLERALTDARGLAGAIPADPGALEALAGRAEGDVRVALNALEAAAERALDRGARAIEPADIDDALRERLLRWDRDGDRHYDVASAFIKSMRASDPNATLAWLARMIAAGEDPRFIARRMVIFASEDIGVADAGSLPTAVAAAQAVEVVGMPEAQLNLAHAAVALALAPKSRAVTDGITAARADLDERGQGEVPAHLRDRNSTAARHEAGAGGYNYPGGGPDGGATYLPTGFEGRSYWDPDAAVQAARDQGKDEG